MRPILRKESKELFRTYRVIILPAVFAGVGLVGPVFMRLLPAIMESAGSGAAEVGMSVQLPDPVPADGLQQYLGMARQFGLLAVILSFMGIIAGERKDGTLAFLFVKPLSRVQYVLLRWSVNGLYTILAFAAGSVVALAATRILLGPPDYATYAKVIALYGAYLLLVYSWTFLFSAAFKKPAIAAGLSLLPLFVFPVLESLWEPLGKWGPYGAVSAGTFALGGMTGPSAPLEPAAVVSAGADVGLALLLAPAAYLLLRRVEF